MAALDRSEVALISLMRSRLSAQEALKSPEWARSLTATKTTGLSSMSGQLNIYRSKTKLIDAIQTREQEMSTRVITSRASRGTPRRRGRTALFAALAAGTMLVAAACSGADGSGAAGGEPDAEGLTWAAETVAEASTRPTTIPFSDPITSPIPTGKTVMWINAGFANPNKVALEQATALLGWNLKIVNTDGSAGQTKNAWVQAVQERPDAVLDSGSPKELFAAELKQLEAAGIPVVVHTATFEPGDGIIAVLGDLADAVRTGELLGAWFIDDSKGKGSALVVNSPSYDTLNRISESFDSTADEHCPTCGVEKLDVSFAQLANVNSQIVAHLSSHPDVKYVVLTADVLGHGLPAALKAAGLDGVTIIGQGVDDTSWNYLKEGESSADISFAYYETSFSMIDALARFYAGVEVPDYPTMPLWLMSSSAAVEVDEFPFAVIPDHVDQFKKAWNVQ